jgi:ATP-dependent Lhr-like helicase
VVRRRGAADTAAALTLAALRAQVEPVSTAAYARFLPAWQQIGSSAGAGVDGWPRSSTSSPGVPVPASAVEPLVGMRVADYQPAMLDELLASGEVTWSRAGSISGSDGWIAFHQADTAPLTLAPPAEIEVTDTHRAILDVLGRPGERAAPSSSASWPTAPRTP